MARLKTNILDAATGSIGNVVVYEMYGKTYVRSKPEKVKNRKRSPAQKRQQQKMNVVVDFQRPFTKLFRVTFAHEAVGRSAYQAAQSFNLKNAVTGNYPDQTIDPAKAFLSAGSIQLPEEMQVTPKEGGLLFEWKNGHFTNVSPFDTLVVMARMQDRPVGDYRVTGIRRSELSYFWSTKLTQYGTIDVWMAFRSEKEDDMSNTFYLGRIN